MGIKDVIDGMRAGRKAGKAAILYRKLFSIHPSKSITDWMQEIASLMYEYDEFQIVFHIVLARLTHEIESHENSGTTLDRPSFKKFRIGLEELVSTGRVHPEKRLEFRELCSRFDGL